MTDLHDAARDVIAWHDQYRKTHGRVVEIDRLSEAVKGSGWQPIASAPRDGTVVWLWLSENIDRYYIAQGRAQRRAQRLTIGFYGSTDPDYHPQEQWCSIEAKEEMWGMGGEMTGPMMETEFIPVSPTHWMPLPAAPSPETTHSIQGEK